MGIGIGMRRKSGCAGVDAGQNASVGTSSSTRSCGNHFVTLSVDGMEVCNDGYESIAKMFVACEQRFES